jgi:hypothetical protein
VIRAEECVNVRAVECDKSALTSEKGSNAAVKGVVEVGPIRRGLADQAETTSSNVAER